MITTPKRIDSLQFLRAFAAISVMIFHGTFMLAEQLKFNFLNKFFVGGYSGVDIFFVISGFIILHTSKRENFSVTKFLKKRFIRIYPIYWVVTILLLLAYYFAPSPDQSFKANPGVMLGSFLLFPQERYIVGVAWTLTYEVIFYIVFALSYSVSKKCLFITLAIWCVIILSTYFLNITVENQVIQNFFNPIILEFAFGCLIAHLYAKYKRVSVWYSIVLIGVVLFFTSWLVYFDAKQYDATAFTSYISRVYLFGVPAMVAIFGLLYFKRSLPSSFVHLGNASYSLYLIHGTVISIILKLIVKFKLEQYFSNTIGAIIIFSLTIIAGSLFYKFIENPLLGWLNSRAKKGATYTKYAGA
jgi:exopolysaccharide production protein ExoZ